MRGLHFWWLLACTCLFGLCAQKSNRKPLGFTDSQVPSAVLAHSSPVCSLFSRSCVGVGGIHGAWYRRLRLGHSSHLLLLANTLRKLLSVCFWVLRGGTFHCPLPLLGSVSWHLLSVTDYQSMHTWRIREFGREALGESTACVRVPETILQLTHLQPDVTCYFCFRAAWSCGALGSEKWTCM